ncbi:MAG: hypothetical protein AAF394_10815 [Planctomycetota bacterium]
MSRGLRLAAGAHAKAAERGPFAEAGSTGAAAEDEFAASPKIRSNRFCRSLLDASAGTGSAAKTLFT